MRYFGPFIQLFSMKSFCYVSCWDWPHKKSISLAVWQKIKNILTSLNLNDMRAVDKASKQIRRWIIATPYFPELQQEITAALTELDKKSKNKKSI